MALKLAARSSQLRDVAVVALAEVLCRRLGEERDEAERHGVRVGDFEGEVDGAERSSVSGVADGGCGATPEVLGAGVVLGAVYLHRAAGGEGCADGVCADAVLAPGCAFDEAEVVGAGQYLRAAAAGDDAAVAVADDEDGGVVAQQSREVAEVRADERRQQEGIGVELACCGGSSGGGFGLLCARGPATRADSAAAKPCPGVGDHVAQMCGGPLAGEFRVVDVAEEPRV
ncbi:hypothetical protein [Pseudoclavibacter helvolus]|uniref:hypothetical protein n=1 Tax=Pseudoclavibacter helvolus TaxID=255205 RepID=UPI000838E206|nr:hypothetical protein [Pseudoclavibacter helvolus]